MALSGTRNHSITNTVACPKTFHSHAAWVHTAPPCVSVEEARDNANHTNVSTKNCRDSCLDVSFAKMFNYSIRCLGTHYRCFLLFLSTEVTVCRKKKDIKFSTWTVLATIETMSFLSCLETYRQFCLHVKIKQVRFQVSVDGDVGTRSVGLLLPLPWVSISSFFANKVRVSWLSGHVKLPLVSR